MFRGEANFSAVLTGPEGALEEWWLKHLNMPMTMEQRFDCLDKIVACVQHLQTIETELNSISDRVRVVTYDIS